MRKKDLRVVGKPSTKLNCELLDSGSEAGMTKNKKDTGIHKKGSPKADSESGCSPIPSFPGRRKSGKGDESGRSMVETLGVLAIMGLLAVGGIMAYRYAVTKYQANETFNELRRRVVVHSQQSIIGTPLSQVEMGDTTQLGYPIAVARVDSGFFELTLQDIDNNLCREMVRTGWTLPTQTRVNGVVVGTNPEACEEENSLVFRFQTEMGGCKTDADCPCGTCESGTCRTSCSSGESCVKNFDDGQYVCCPGGSVKGKFCCETVNEAGECCDADGNCCPPDKPLIDGQGRCQACQGTLVLKNKNDCDKCSETHQLHYQWASYRCSPKCPNGQVMATDGKCHGCNDAPFEIGQKSAEDGFIDLCESICPNRQITQTQRGGGYPYVCAVKCTEPDTFMDGYGNCQPCSSESVIKASQTECHKCGNRVLEWANWCHRCDLVEGDLGTNQSWCLQCPNLIARYGGCSVCDSPEEALWTGWMSQDNSQVIINSCLQCENRYYDGNWHSGYCIQCPEDLSTLTPEQQAQCGG